MNTSNCTDSGLGLFGEQISDGRVYSFAQPVSMGTHLYSGQQNAVENFTDLLSIQCGDLFDTPENRVLTSG